MKRRVVPRESTPAVVPRLQLKLLAIHGLTMVVVTILRYSSNKVALNPNPCGAAGCVSFAFPFGPPSAVLLRRPFRN